MRAHTQVHRGSCALPETVAATLLLRSSRAAEAHNNDILQYVIYVICTSVHTQTHETRAQHKFRNVAVFGDTGLAARLMVMCICYKPIHIQQARTPTSTSSIVLYSRYNALSINSRHRKPTSPRLRSRGRFVWCVLRFISSNYLINCMFGIFIFRIMRLQSDQTQQCIYGHNITRVNRLCMF